MKKFISILLALVLAIGVFAGCDLLESDPKTFTEGDFTITLNEDFKVSDEDNGYDITFSSGTAIVFVLEEDFEYFDEDTKLDEYVELSLEANDCEELEIQDAGDYLYVEYTDDVEGEEYYYMVAYYEGSDAFWVVNFSTPESYRSTMEAKFTTWASSIEVE